MATIKKATFVVVVPETQFAFKNQSEAITFAETLRDQSVYLQARALELKREDINKSNIPHGLTVQVAMVPEGSDDGFEVETFEGAEYEVRLRKLKKNAEASDVDTDEDTDEDEDTDTDTDTDEDEEEEEVKPKGKRK